MQTYTIQLKNIKAYKLLQELEELNLIKVLEKKSTSKKKLSDRLAGSLSNEQGIILENELINMREQWQRDI